MIHGIEQPHTPAVFTKETDILRIHAAHHINKHYPAWKQLNILRAGVKSDAKRMGVFIDAVRAWSNQAKPSLAALELIKP